MTDAIKANATGELSDTAREQTAQSQRAEMPERAFLNRAEKKYPVMRKIDGEWRWDCNLILAAARRARMNGDDAIATKAEELRQRICVQQPAGGKE